MRDTTRFGLLLLLVPWTNNDQNARKQALTVARTTQPASTAESESGCESMPHVEQRLMISHAVAHWRTSEGQVFRLTIKKITCTYCTTGFKIELPNARAGVCFVTDHLIYQPARRRCSLQAELLHVFCRPDQCSLYE
jgi:hypothetical protein